MKKVKLILERLVQMIPVLLGISIITFVLAQAAPGDPARLRLGPRATEESMAQVREQFGLERPVVEQYLIYMKNLLRGDLGHSIVFRKPIAELIQARIIPTLYLVFGGLVFSVIPTLILATLATMKPEGLLDQTIRMFYIIALGMPAFWLGIVLILFFAVRRHWFPVSGFGETFTDHIHHMILPWTTIGLAMTPILVRNLRATLLEKKEADFVTAGRSKGLPERYIFLRHIFPNSILPSLHLLGVVVIYVLGISVIIEPIFVIPGLGQLFIDSIIGRDYFVVQGLTLVFALLTIFSTLSVDLLSMMIDPRIE